MIESIRFGEIKVSGKTFETDIILLPGNEIKPWWRKEGSRVNFEDLNELLKSNPKRLIIGNGMYRMLGILPNIRTVVESKGIRLDVYQSEQAVAEYNKVSGAGDVVAAIHIRE